MNRLSLEKLLDLLFLFTMLDMVLLLAINPPTIIVFTGYLIFLVGTFLFLLYERGRLSHDIIRLAVIYSVYVCVAILIFQAQYLTIPSYYGFSGPEGGIGTDDTYYYTLAAPNLPAEFPTRPNYHLMYHPFGNTLSVFANLIYYITDQLHPLDLIILNAAILALLPIATYKTAYAITQDRRIASTAGVLTLVCPFIISNGLILVRDGWTAVLSMVALFNLVKKRYVPLAFVTVLLAYIRLSSALLLVTIMLIMVIHEMYQARGSLRELVRYSLLFFVIVIIVANYYESILLYLSSAGVDISSMFRAEFVESFLALEHMAGAGETSTFYEISKLNPFLRVPLAFLFFLGLPYIVLIETVRQGVIIPRQVLSIGFGVLFFFYFKYFVQAIFALRKSKAMGVGIILTLFIISTLILSQLSMQPRHKTQIMPLFYIVVAFGYHYPTRLGQELGVIAVVGLFCIVFFVNVINFL